MKEAEQERQWKALQAMRAREQQMGMPPEQRMLLMNGESRIFLNLKGNLFCSKFQKQQIQTFNCKSQRQ